MKNNTVKHPVRNDILLIVCLLAAAAIGLLYLFVFRGHGDTVTVTVDGKPYGEYPLSQNRIEEIGTGEHRNRLVIRDGKAQMEFATCPDGICVAHPPISRDGESIVCLPHRVVVTVTTKHSTNDPDIII